MGKLICQLSLSLFEIIFRDLTQASLDHMPYIGIGGRYEIEMLGRAGTRSEERGGSMHLTPGTS